MAGDQEVLEEVVLRVPARTGALMLAVLAGGCSPSPAPTPVAAPSATQPPATELTVGVLLHLSGAQAGSGASIRAGLEVALEDLNAYLRPSGRQLRLQVEDGATDRTVALTKLQAMEAAGIKVVIGPNSSDSLAHLREYATAHGLVLVSPSSTAPSLALEDLIVRTAPLDVLQGRAIAMLASDLALRELVTLHRGDAWGSELNQEVGLAAPLFASTLRASHSYPVDAVSYSSTLASVSASVQQAIERVGTGSVAVALLSFDEAKDLMRGAQADPVLRSVRWLGCDGNALSAAIAGDAEASAFAGLTGFVASTFLNPFDAGHPEATRSAGVPEFASLKARIQTRLGTVPTQYAYTGYDSLWLVGLAAEALRGGATPSGTVDAIWRAALSFRGASGAMGFTPTLDRTRGDFGFFGLQDRTWVRRATFLDGLTPTATTSTYLRHEGGGR